MQESMGLASMNPMVGTNSNSGSYIVNVMNHDKDLGDAKNYTGLAKSLDVDSNLYGIDQNGKVQAKKRYDVMNQEDIVEVFKITSSDAEVIAESIIREAILPYDQRPIHGQNYIYEVFTKKPFMMHEQFYFEPILEKGELEKMSAGLAGVVTGNDRTMNMQHKGKKQSNYIPDNDYPSGTENLHYSQESFSVKSSLKDNFHSKTGINLASFKKIPMSDSSIATYKSKCKGLSHVRTGSDYIGTIFVDKQNDVVAYINIRKSDSCIQGLEVSEKYRGQHLSPQLVQYAEKDLHASKLTVNKSNEVAYSLYKKLGWKDDHIDGQMIHMIKENNTLLKEITRTKYILEEAKDIETGKHKIPYKCEIKNSYHTLNGIVKNPLPMLILHSDKKNWRVRAELLLMKDDQLWLMKEDKPNHYGLMYKLPGGGIDDTEEYIEDACIRECTEEILIVPKNVIYTGVDIKQVYPHIPEWHKITLWKDNIRYDGSLSFICIGEYDKPYKGYVKKVDRMSNMVQKGKFYQYSEIKRILHPKHRKVIEKYLKERGYMK